MFTINAKGLTELQKKFSTLSNNVKQEVVVELKAFGQLTVTDAKSLVQSNSSDTGNLASSISYEVNGYELKISASANYAAFVEFGTRKFAQEHVSSLPTEWQQYAQTFKGKKTGNMDDFKKRLVTWGKKKGLTEDEAYNLAKYIMIHGTPAKPFLYPSINKNLSIFIQKIKGLFKL